MNIDLHTHTTYSDGLLSPKELIQSAAERNLAAVAITDHDEVAGIEEAESMGQSLGVEVIAGIEISTFYKGMDVHVLGYFIDYKSKVIQDYVEKCKVWREKRAQKIVNKLHKMGIRLPFELVLYKAGAGCIGRPHIADVMVEQGYVFSFQEAFEKYLADNRPAFVPKTQIETREAVSKIQSAGGLTFLAHPSVSLLEQHIYDILV
jgi:predicted metal-dependent phosphoesterase TrpH